MKRHYRQGFYLFTFENGEEVTLYLKKSEAKVFFEKIMHLSKFFHVKELAYRFDY